VTKSLVIRPPAIARMTALPLSKKHECWLAISQLPEAFGRPHEHSGLGIRKMKPNVFECRAGLDLRLLFVEEDDALYVTFVGTHDEVRKQLKSGKYG